MEKYIIAVDLDETLLKKDKTIGRYTLDILKKCKQNGAYIVISTARGYWHTKDVALQIDADYCCCQLGNLIVDSKGEIVYEQRIDEKVKLDFLNKFCHYTDEIFFDGFYGVLGTSPTYLGVWDISPCTRKKLEQTEVIQICLKNDETYIDKINEFCLANNLTHDVMCTNFSFISPQNTNKWNALEILMQKLGIKNQNVFVFGDDVTDLVSIMTAGNGVAMQNSKQQVLEKAKNIAPENEQEGVAKYLENNFLKK